MHAEQRDDGEHFDKTSGGRRVNDVASGVGCAVMGSGVAGLEVISPIDVGFAVVLSDTDGSAGIGQIDGCPTLIGQVDVGCTVEGACDVGSAVMGGNVYASKSKSINLRMGEGAVV